MTDPERDDPPPPTEDAGDPDGPPPADLPGWVPTNLGDSVIKGGRDPLDIRAGTDREDEGT